MSIGHTNRKAKNYSRLVVGVVIEEVIFIVKGPRGIVAGLF